MGREYKARFRDGQTQRQPRLDPSGRGWRHIEHRQQRGPPVAFTRGRPRSGMSPSRGTLAARFLLRRAQRQAQLVNALADRSFRAVEFLRDGAGRGLLFDQRFHRSVIRARPAHA